MEQHRSSLTTTKVTLLNVATAGFILIWVSAACYAIAYLVAH
jgi:hypothetical protein